jgi:hypothetical protein
MTDRNHETIFGQSRYACSAQKWTLARVSSLLNIPIIFLLYIEHLLWGNFWFLYVLYSTLFHLPPFRFHYVGGCWDQTQDSCDFAALAVSRSNYLAIDLIHNTLNIVQQLFSLSCLKQATKMPSML